MSAIFYRLKAMSLLMLFAFAALGGVAACDNNDGPVEKAGEKVDEAGQHVQDQMKDAKDDLDGDD